MIAKVKVIIGREFRRLNRLAPGGILLLLIVQIGVTYVLQVWLWDYSLLEWLRNVFIPNLHDGPVQKIAALSLHLNVHKSMVAFESQKLPRELATLEDIANLASHELRHMMFTLRPLLLDKKGLGSAVGSLLLQINEQDGIETSLTGQEFGQVLTLPA